MSTRYVHHANYATTIFYHSYMSIFCYHILQRQASHSGRGFEWLFLCHQAAKLRLLGLAL